MTVQPFVVEPVLGYPSRAEAGRRYLFTVDLRQSEAAAWPDPRREEIVVHCLINASPLFECENAEATVIAHRFGGTYGPARFVLTAAALSPEEPEKSGTIRVTLIGESGLPLAAIQTPEIKLQFQANSSTRTPAVREARGQGITAMAVTSDGGQLWIGGDDGKIRVRDLNTGAESTIDAHDGPVLCLSRVRNTRTVMASGGRDGQIILWRRSLEPDMKFKHEDAVWSLAADHEEWMVSGSADMTVRVWNWPYRVQYSKRVMPDWVRAVGYIPDAETVIAACDDGSLHQMRLRDSKGPAVVLKTPARVNAFAVAESTHEIAAGLADGSVCIWRLGEAEPEPVQPHESAIRAIAATPDGRIIITGDDQGLVRVWDRKLGLDRGGGLTLQGRVSSLALFEGQAFAGSETGEFGQLEGWHSTPLLDYRMAVRAQARNPAILRSLVQELLNDLGRGLQPPVTSVPRSDGSSFYLFEGASPEASAIVRIDRPADPIYRNSLQLLMSPTQWEFKGPQTSEVYAGELYNQDDLQKAMQEWMDLGRAWRSTDATLVITGVETWVPGVDQFFEWFRTSSYGSTRQFDRSVIDSIESLYRALAALRGERSQRERRRLWIYISCRASMQDEHKMLLELKRDEWFLLDEMINSVRLNGTFREVIVVGDFKTGQVSGRIYPLARINEPLSLVKKDIYQILRFSGAFPSLSDVVIEGLSGRGGWRISSEMTTETLSRFVISRLPDCVRRLEGEDFLLSAGRFEPQPQPSSRGNAIVIISASESQTEALSLKTALENLPLEKPRVSIVASSLQQESIEDVGLFVTMLSPSSMRHVVWDDDQRQHGAHGALVIVSDNPHENLSPPGTLQFEAGIHRLPTKPGQETKRIAESLLRHLGIAILDVAGVFSLTRASIVLMGRMGGSRATGFVLEGAGVVTAGFAPSQLSQPHGPESLREPIPVKTLPSTRRWGSQPAASLIRLSDQRWLAVPALKPAAKPPAVGERVVLVGWRQNGELTPVGGIVRSIEKESFAVEFEEKDLNGCGGAPVVDSAGQVYGMIHSHLLQKPDGRKWEECVPVEALMNFSPRPSVRKSPVRNVPKTAKAKTKATRPPSRKK